MNKTKETGADKKTVKWEKIGQSAQENLDLLVDYFRDEELFLLKETTLSGPYSTRKLWNLLCEDIYSKKIDAGRPGGGGEPQNKKEELSETEYYSWVRNKLKENNVKFPSYHKIKKHLEELEELRLLKKREMKTGQSKFLWVVHPGFKKAYRERKQELVEELQDLDEEIINQKYQNEVLDFYNSLNLIR